jgi:hypothetical protein
MGTTQLQYVPYSFYSLGVAASNVNGILPIEKGGTGVGSLEELKKMIYKSILDSLLPETAGGTGFNSLAKLKAALNLDTTSSSLPVVSATDPTSFSGNGAYINGTIINDGGAMILKQGICYDTTINPTVSNSLVFFKELSGSNNSHYLKGDFDASLNSLIPNTKYYYRTFAVNKNGTGYSGLKKFTTKGVAIFTATPTIVLNKNIPTISFKILAVGDTVNGYVVFINQGSISSNYQTISNPFSNTITERLIYHYFTGQYPNSSPNPNLSFNTDYTFYIQLYSTNGINKSIEVPFRVGSYTPSVTFTWSSGFSSVLTTSNGTSFDYNYLGVSENGSPVTEAGLCWSTSSNPTYTQNTKSIKNGTSPISVSNLVPGTLYYFRGYAVNAIGVGYSEEVQVRMPTAPLNVSSVTLSSLNATSVVSVYNNGAGDNGGAYITSSGICWSTSPNPTNTLSTNVSTTIIGTPISRTLTGLAPNTLYYIRCYSTNSVGTTYGPTTTFTTSP